MSIANSSEEKNRRSVFRKKPQQDENISEEYINERIEITPTKVPSQNSRNESLV